MENLEVHQILEVLPGGKGILVRTEKGKYLYLVIKDKVLLGKLKGTLMPLSALLPGVDNE